jgi:phosphate transport system substrate-binding protein
VQGAVVDGKEPTFEAIAAGEYPVSRPLYFYVKKAHVGTIPGIQEFLAEFSSERAWGEEGYLADKGLIPMPSEERNRYAEMVHSLAPLDLK